MRREEARLSFILRKIFITIPRAKEVMKMSKYVSFRIEKSTMKGVSNQMNHDLRFHSPAYVDKERTKLNEILHVDDDISSLDSKKCKNITKCLKEQREARIKELTGRRAQENAELFFKGIMTFSSSMQKDYEANPELFNECSQAFIERLDKDFGVKALYAMAHHDEFNPHIHLIFDNIDRSTGKSVRRKINPKVLRKCQDIMGECFAPMGYARGKPIEETNAKHLSVKELQRLGALKDALESDLATMDTLIAMKEAKDDSVLFLMRMLESKGHIDVKSVKGLEALERVKSSLKPRHSEAKRNDRDNNR